MNERKNPRAGARVVRRAALLTLTGFALALLGSGCGRSTDAGAPADLRPLDPDGAASPLRDSADDSPGTGDKQAQRSNGSGATGPQRDPASGSSTSGVSAGPGFGVGGTRTDDPADLAVVRDLLARYDDLVTRLAVFPGASAESSARVRSEWAKLVPAESALSSDVLNLLVVRPLAAGTRLMPGPDGVSFRHHVERTGRRDDDSIEFSWCGYSPGIRVDATSGAVLDDQVAHLRGIGRADRSTSDPALWVLDSFDQLDMVVLPAGSNDPCPAAGGAGGRR